jgi:hypothetical protein
MAWIKLPTLRFVVHNSARFKLVLSTEYKQPGLQLTGHG